jgi:hypothetical protein
MFFRFLGPRKPRKLPVVSCSRKCRRLWLACKPFSARKSSGGKIDSDPNLKMFHIRIVSTPDVVEPNSPHTHGEKSDESCNRLDSHLGAGCHHQGAFPIDTIFSIFRKRLKNRGLIGWCCNC